MTCMRLVCIQKARGSSPLSSTPEGRASRVPDEVVGRGLPRSLSDNTADVVTWLSVREAVRGGDLTRKRSLSSAPQIDFAAQEASRV